MKFYQLIILVLSIHQRLPCETLWSKCIDTITAKINHTTDVILHKEFNTAKYLELNNTTGAIIVNSWKQNSIAIEVIISCSESLHKDVKVDMECIDDTIKINTILHDEKIKATVVFNILVPKNMHLTMTTKKGDIMIKDVTSPLAVQTQEGTIKVINPYSTVRAHTDSGNIIFRTETLEAHQEFFLSSKKGNISCYTTQAMNSYLHAQALQGKVTSDLFITLDSTTTLLNTQAWQHFKQIVHGTIGAPLSQLHITAENGSIGIMSIIKDHDIF